MTGETSRLARARLRAPEALPLAGPRRVVLLLALLLAVAVPTPAIGSAEGVRVAGLAVDAEGRPVARARALLLPTLSDRELYALELDGRTRPEAVARAESGGDGRFALLAPAPGMWTVVVEAPGRAALRRRLSPLLFDTVLEPAPLPAAEPLAVAVLDAGGRPAAGAAVLVGRSAGDELWQPGRLGDWRPASRLLLADGKGRGRTWRARGESVRVQAFRPDHLPSPVARPAGGAVELRLRPGERHRLAVRDAAGEPVPDAMVRLFEWAWIPGVSDAAGELEVVVEPGSTVDLAVDLGGGQVATGSFAFAATADGGRGGEGEAGDDPDSEPAVQEIALPESVEVAGEVVDLESGRPLAGAWVWSRDQARSPVRTDGAGRFSLARFRPQLGARAAALAAAAAGHLPAGSRDSPRAGEPVRLALRPAAAIRGRVVDAGGSPVAGASVVAHHLRREFQAPLPAGGESRALAGEDGSFALSGLAPGWRYEVTATAAGWAAARTEVTAPGAAGGERRRLELVLDRGAELAGWIVDAVGAPVAGARVELHRGQPPEGPRTPRRISSPEPLASVRAGETGGFLVPTVAAGDHQLRIEAPGFAPFRLPVEVEPAAGRVDLGELALEPAATLVGRIVDRRGRPVEGAVITGHGAAPSDGATSDADGGFQLAGLAPGRPLHLRVEHPEYVSRSVSDVRPGTEALEVTLLRGATVRGRVESEDGEPVADALVAWTPTERSAMTHFTTHRPQRTDASGRFELSTVPPGRLHLVAGLPGQPFGEKAEIDVADEAEAGPVVLTLAASRWLRGQILRPDGLPAAGARVLLTAEALGSSVTRTAVTDPSGEYRLAHAGTGSAELTALLEGVGRASRRLELAPEEQRVDLVLEPGEPVAGRVVEEDGRPAVADLRLFAAGAGAQGLTARSDDDGEFRFAAAAPGAWHLAASVADGRTATADLEVPPGGLEGVELRLPPGGEIFGRVVGAEAAHLESLSVAATPVDGGATRPGRVRQGGEFRIPGVSPGRWRVSASDELGGRAGSSVVEVAESTPAGPVIVELEPAASLAVRVLDDAGRPVAGRPVLVFTASGQGRDRTTDAAGNARFAALSPGVHRVQVDLGAGGRLQRTVELEGDAELELRTRRTVVTGHVVDGAGRPLAGRRVWLRPVPVGEPPGADGAYASAESGADGAFRLAPPGRGAHLLHCRLGPDEPGLPVQLGVGEQSGLVCVVDPPDSP